MTPENRVTAEITRIHSIFKKASNLADFYILSGLSKSPGIGDTDTVPTCV